MPRSPYKGVGKLASAPPPRGRRCPASGQFAFAGLGDTVQCPVCRHFVAHGKYGLVLHYVPTELLER